MTKTKNLVVGIDASNLRSGGGVTHLIEFLRASNPRLHGFERIVIWGGEKTLRLLDDKKWLTKRIPSALNKGLLHRSIWQRFQLSGAARLEGCDVLFVPGGSYAGNFHPVITMSRNLLPFEISELLRYGLTFFTLKLLLLRYTQSRSFRNADGVIFLTKYAQDIILHIVGNLHGKIKIIPHGLNPRFNRAPKTQISIDRYSRSNPYKVLYVSTIDQYKHQWNVVKAVAYLRERGLPVTLDLVGSAYSPALKRLNRSIAQFDFDGTWVNYHGTIPFNDLHLLYAEADLGLFASSCENMPNILLETMGSGLPIACSDRGPMPEVLGSAGVFFDPEQPEDIAKVLYELIMSAKTRESLAYQSYKLAQQYSWERCADETLNFLLEVVKKHKKGTQYV